MDNFNFDSTYIYHNPYDYSICIFIITSKEEINNSIKYTYVPLLENTITPLVFTTFVSTSVMATESTLLCNQKLTVEQLYDLYPEYII